MLSNKTKTHNLGYLLWEASKRKKGQQIIIWWGSNGPLKQGEMGRGWARTDNGNAFGKKKQKTFLSWYFGLRWNKESNILHDL